MHRLGISVYPEKSTQKEVYDYLELAAKYGFSRIFTCLLSVNDPKREFDSCLQFFTNQIAQNVDYINAFEFFYCQIR